MVKSAAAILSSVLIVLCVALSSMRASLYRDAVTLWSDTVAKSPNKARVQNEVGFALKRAENLPAAARHLTRAVELRPDYVVALNNLASVAFSLGHKEEALVYIRRAIALDDAYLPAHVSLAMWYVEAGMGPGAAQEFDLIVRRSPMGPDAVFARGMLSLIGQSAPGAATR